VEIDSNFKLNSDTVHKFTLTNKLLEVNIFLFVPDFIGSKSLAICILKTESRKINKVQLSAGIQIGIFNSIFHFRLDSFCKLFQSLN